MKNNEEIKESSANMKMKKEYKLELILCLIYAVLIQLYFISLNYNRTLAEISNFNLYVKFSYIVFMIVAVFMFEIAYKTRKKNFLVNGIEFIALSIYTLLAEKSGTQTNILEFSYIWPIYYCLKAMIIYTIQNKKRLGYISDISEIVKEEKPIKKVAKKRKK